MNQNSRQNTDVVYCFKWISLFTRKSGSNKKREKQTHKLN